ncbi:asparagine synthase (glutamine-hydrolyzing) [Marinilabiliaceae bacterium ANBcel2]|nr:asparagine synthase (glutamine-hydrolyzing) [Marinilabiliaceae bacterium ANBcel2]
MCGINGIVSAQIGDRVNRVSLMNGALLHRGPDDEGVLSFENATFGHRRLSVIDLSKAGHQPMESACGRFVMVFNGEVYNYRELKQKLNYPFKSQTDSEVVLAAWSIYGKESLCKLEGMFAFAIYDKYKNVVLLARDRMGVKPLYYINNSIGFAFSSEIRSLMLSGLSSKSISKNSLIDYLRYQTVQSPCTIIEDIKMLPASAYLEYNIGLGVFRIDHYSRLSDIGNEYGSITIEEARKGVRERFFKAVEKRLVADVPLGAFLSGGIDSAAIVGAMAKLSSTKVKTFNIAFAEEEYSEARYARYVADMHSTDHTEIKLSGNHFLEHLPDALKAMDHPSGDGPNTWMVSKTVKERGIDVALSGLGGDEVFAGYAIFKRMMLLEKYSWLWHFPNIIRSSAGTLLCKARPGIASAKIAELLKMKNYDFNRAFSFSRQVLMDDYILRLLNLRELPPHLMIENLNYSDIRFDKNHTLSKVSVAEMQTYMQTVLLRDSDQMSMAHALELRVPFMDYDLIKYVLSLPDNFKYPVTPKKLLVDSLPDLLPPYITDRKKMGFEFPWEYWLRNELRGYATVRIENIASRAPFNKEGVRSLWNRFLKKDPSVTYSRIWPLVVLEEWMSSNGI